MNAEGNIVIELGDRLDGAVATMSGEADELAARRPHPDAHLYDIEIGLRQSFDCACDVRTGASRAFL